MRPRSPLVAALALALISASPARAQVLPAQTLDGPSADLLELDGVAMSADGSGGLVYRRRVGGHAHVFAARLLDGRWQPPQRIDAGQLFDAAWPVIGAGDGGRLVVVWAQDFGLGGDRLFSASLDPGASSFQTPVPIDLDVGEDAATRPSLAMAPGGQALLAYRVETNPSGTGLPPGYVGADVRLARYDGSFWSTLSPLANRVRGGPVPRATAANAPKVAISVTGTGLVAFVEPDDRFVDRLWARRVFGASVSNSLLASPTSFGGLPLRGGVDAFALAEAGFGEGTVAFRQQAGESAALVGPHVLAATIPDAFSQDAGQFTTAGVLDGSPTMTLPAPPGALSVGVSPQGAVAVGYGLGRGSWIGTADDAGSAPPTRLDDGSAPTLATPAVVLAGSGAAAQAWNENGLVELREVTADGVPATTPLSGSAGGVVRELELAGSGHGDAAVAWRQGDLAAATIDAAALDAPPQAFTLQTPIGWTRARRVAVSWDPAQNALGPVTYSLTVDDEEVRDGLTGTSARLGSGDLPDGRHAVQAIASDRLGQQVESQPSELDVDRRAPRVRTRMHGLVLTVVVSDPASGVRASSVRISLGDGSRSRRARTHHRYGRAGVYRVLVRARDRAGNRRTLHLKVTVR